MTELKKERAEREERRRKEEAVDAVGGSLLIGGLLLALLWFGPGIYDKHICERCNAYRVSTPTTEHVVSGLEERDPLLAEIARNLDVTDTVQVRFPQFRSPHDGSRISVDFYLIFGFDESDQIVFITFREGAEETHYRSFNSAQSWRRSMECTRLALGQCG